MILKKDREKAVLNKHPWIFSGAVFKMPEVEDGEIVDIYSFDKKFLAKGFIHTKNSIAARIITFSKEDALQALSKSLEQSIANRGHLIHRTNAYRLVNAEGDQLPGLIIDFYNGICVLQITTFGMNKLKDFIVQELKRLVNPRAIYEKSNSSARQQEGLKPSVGWIYGNAEKEVEIIEDGIKHIVPIEDGQKTGFFLDQREMRSLIFKYAKDKKVLNCFSYTGGFSLSALLGGAESAISVDSCERCLKIIEKNLSLNQLDKSKHTTICEDVFKYFESQESLQSNLVILDPPAFVKRRNDLEQGADAYKNLNRACLQKLPKNSLLLTSSCSYFIDEDFFKEIIFRASLEAKRQVRIIGQHIQATDHPCSIYHPEGKYLKSLFLHVE